MDRCNYCREYHAPHEVCDGYIEFIQKDLLGAIEHQKKREAEIIKGQIEIAIRRTEKLCKG